MSGVSVVIPAHNSAWSIRDTLRSVINQTHGDMEILVVDDGSTDSLIEVLEPFCAVEPRLRILRQANGGLAKARNRGLAEASRDLVAFLDADDLWHPRFLETVTAALAARPEAPFGYALSVRIDLENRIIPTPRWRHSPRHDLTGLIEVNTVGNGSASVFRRPVLSAAGGFDTTLRDRNAHGAEDWKLSLSLAARHPPALVPEQLVAYRLVPSGMSRGNPEIQMRSIREVIEHIRTAHPETGDSTLRNARTVMNGWLMPAFLARGRYRDVLWMLWESYGLNPLWFLSRDVRAIHLQKLASIWQDRGPRKPLADLVERGERPFAFLSETTSLSPMDEPSSAVAVREGP